MDRTMMTSLHTKETHIILEALEDIKRTAEEGTEDAIRTTVIINTKASTTPNSMVGMVDSHTVWATTETTSTNEVVTVMVVWETRMVCSNKAAVIISPVVFTQEVAFKMMITTKGRRVETVETAAVLTIAYNNFNKVHPIN